MKHPPVFLMPGEFRVLADCAPERDRLLLIFLVLTGLRWAEATALRREDIDLNRSVVHVRRAWQWSSEGGAELGPGKSRLAIRDVPLPEQLIGPLQARINEQPLCLWVFATPMGKPIRANDFHAEVWQSTRRLARGLDAYPNEWFLRDSGGVHPERKKINAELRYKTPATSPSRFRAADDEKPTPRGQTSVSVRHEDLRGRRDVRYLHSTPEVLPIHSPRTDTNVTARYS